MTPFDADAIREIDVGIRPESSLAALSEVTDRAMVVAGAVAVLTEDVTASSAEDVLRSLLLSQLVANAKVNRFREPSAWYDVYQATLENIGWVVSTSSFFSQYRPALGTYTIVDVVQDTLRRRLSAAEGELLITTLHRFTQDSQSAAQRVWECPSHSGGIGNFQVTLATAVGEALSLDLAKIYFDGPTHTTRLADEPFERSTKFTTAYVHLTLNAELFDRLRSAIVTKLEGRYEALVVAI